MALFSFRHSVKTFSEKRTDEARAAKPGQTNAHLRYITRSSAARVVIKERLSGETLSDVSAKAEKEAQKRKGRVCERFVVALPVEATPEQREALTRAFANCLSKGIAGYVAAIHDQAENDINNPHVHYVFFDLQQKTGGRGRPKSTLGLSHKNSLENAAKMWADIHNEMMHNWGYGPSSNITQLSFIHQGIERIPTIHEGAGARAKPKLPIISKEQWRHVDQGHKRAEANAIIKEINQLKKEHEDAGTIRLGTSNDYNPPQRGGSFAEQRACGRRNGEAADGEQAPFWRSVEPNQRDTEARGRTNPATCPPSGRTLPSSGKQPPFLATTLTGSARGFRHRRSVRRIFRELTMLRDTLRARLFLTDRGRYSDAIAPKQETPISHLHGILEINQGGAERGECPSSNDLEQAA